MKILITGPQGSGKTTHAKIVAEKFNLCFIKTGDLVRNKALENSDEGRKLKEALDKGELADDRIIANLVENALVQQNCKDNFVMDGYPRRLPQLQVFDPGFDKVFYLDLSDEMAIERMLKRGREDDTPQLIQQRLMLYHRETEKALKYYQTMGILIKINAARSIGEVAGDIVDHLKRHGNKYKD